MVTYTTVMVPNRALRRRRVASISPRSPGCQGLPRNPESSSSPGSSSTRDIGTNTECSICLGCNSKATKDREVTGTSVDKDPKHTQGDGLFCNILSVLFTIAGLLIFLNGAYQKWMIATRYSAEKMAPLFLDEFIHLQDMAQQEHCLRENFFGTKENVPRIPFSRRGEVGEESVRAIHALINVYEGVGIKNVAKYWRAHLVKIGKSIRGPIDSVTTIEIEGSEELFSYVKMLLEVCLIDEALEILDHEMLTRLSVHKVEYPLKCPWTAQIQEHIDRVKQFDVMYCRPAQPEQQQKRIRRF